MLSPDRYRDLLRFTYLVSAYPVDGPARGTDSRGLVRRLARWRLPAGTPDEEYAALRRRVIKHLLTKEARLPPAPPLTAGILRERRLPDEDAPRLWSALQALDLRERVAYVLQRADGLSPEEARAVLGAASRDRRGDGERTEDDVTGPIAEIDEWTELAPGRQRELVSDPDIDVLLSQPTLADEVHRNDRFWLRAGAVTVAVAVLVAGGWSYLAWRAPPAPVVTSVAEARRPSSFLSWTGWPTRGSLRDDGGLLRRARDAWLDPQDVPPYGSQPIRVLYAGDASGWPTVVMVQEAAMLLAEYVEYEDDTQLRVFPVHDALDVLVVDAGEDRVRFVVPQWVGRLEVAPVRGEKPTWRTVGVRRGVSEPVQLHHHCRPGILVRTSTPIGDETHPTTYVYKQLGVNHAPYVGAHAPYPARLRVTTVEDDDVVYNESPRVLNAPSTMRQLHGVLCGGPPNRDGRPMEAIRVRELWHGRVPWQDEPASVGIVERTYTYDEPAVETTVTDSQLVVGYTTSSDVGSHLLARSYGEQPAAVAAGWLKDDSGRWWFVAAGAPEVSRIRALGAPRPPIRGERFAAVRGPKQKDEQERPDLPNIAVVAYDARGDVVDTFT